jgi:hypothetical protein
MSEKHFKPENAIETRGELNPAQELICNQLLAVLDELEGVEVHAIGVVPNMVLRGGTESPCVWFGIEGRKKPEFRISAAINTFKGKDAAVVSDYSFRPYRDKLTVTPFGATLGSYVLPDIDIELQK